MAVLIYPELSYQINGAIYEVYNTLGFGHKELVYHRALGEEFIRRKISHESEPVLPVLYKGKQVGNYRPDFIINSKVIIEIKSLNFIPKETLVQLDYYLKGTNFRLGLLVNFGSKSLQICRRVWGHD